MGRAIGCVVVALTGLFVLIASRPAAGHAATTSANPRRMATGVRVPRRRVTKPRPRRTATAGTLPPHLPTAVLGYLGGLHMVTPAIGWLNAGPGTIFRTTNAAHTWTKVFQSSPGTSMLAWAAPTAQTAWGVVPAATADQMQVWSTTDAGVQWHAVTLVTPWPIILVHLQVAPNGTGSVIASGQEVVSMQSTQERLWRIADNAVVTTPVYTTNNGQFLGASWTSATDGWATATSAAANDTATVLFRTTDGGHQWTSVGLPLPPSVPVPTGFSHFAPNLNLSRPPTSLGPDDGYLMARLSLSSPTSAPTTYPVLYHTTNDRTWRPLWLGPAHHILTQLQWVSGRVIWAVLSPSANSTSTRIAVSTTAGRLWTVSMAPVQSATVYDLMAVSSTRAILYVLLPMQVLKTYTTTNGGRTWQASR